MPEYVLGQGDFGELILAVNTVWICGCVYVSLCVGAYFM